jgi:glycosyltransferase involved in cell wall biosynthesis
MSDSRPLVSVCVPVYNNEDYIVETMENILEQSYPNIELIIVDDNSKDDSLKKIRETAKKAAGIVAGTATGTAAGTAAGTATGTAAGTATGTAAGTSAEAQDSAVGVRLHDFSDKEINYVAGTNFDPATQAPKIDFENCGIDAVEDTGRSVFIYKNHDNLGMSGNWNRCLSLCRGKYIKLICADDLIAPDLIEREVSILEKYPEVLDVESDTEFRDPENKPQGQYKRMKLSW